MKLSLICFLARKMGENRDKGTQVDFPIVVRTQKQLRRHFTSDNLRLQRTTSHQQWSTLSSRPKSIHLLDTTPIRARLTSISASSCNTLMQNHRSTDSSSYPGSDLTVTSDIRNKERSPGSSVYNILKSKNYPSPDSSILYSGHFQSEHQSKWRFGMTPPPRVEPPHSKINHNSPEGLSWRRLHMSRAKLKATATTSELLSGFAMVAMVELQIDDKTNVPEWLFVLFAICTTVLVAVHIFALMISTYILPNIDAISKLEVSELVTESPHERMKGFIELAWAFSTILGLFLFLVEIAILCWVKFWGHIYAAMAATIVVIPVLVLFVGFAIHFYHSLVKHKCVQMNTDLAQLETMHKELQDKINPV